MKRAWALGMGLAVALAMLLAGELALEAQEARAVVRIADPPALKYAADEDPADPDRGYHEGRTPPDKAPGSRRVIAVGDSVTFGLAVDAGQAWPAVLQRDLGIQLSMNRIEVLNFGVNGYDAGQVAALVETRLAAWQPDLVLWGAYNNDVAPTWVLHSESLGQPIFVAPASPEMIRLGPPVLDAFLLRHSAAARRLQGARFTRALASQMDLPDPEGFFEDALGRILAWGQQEGVPIGILAIPPHVLSDPTTCPSLVTGPDQCAMFLARHAEITAAIAASGAPWVDLLPAFQASGRREFFPPGLQDPDHPSGEGQALIAREALGLAQRMLGVEERSPESLQEALEQRPHQGPRRGR